MIPLLCMMIAWKTCLPCFPPRSSPNIEMSTNPCWLMQREKKEALATSFFSLDSLGPSPWDRVSSISSPYDSTLSLEYYFPSPENHDHTLRARVFYLHVLYIYIPTSLRIYPSFFFCLRVPCTWSIPPCLPTDAHLVQLFSAYGSLSEQLRDPKENLALLSLN